MPRASHHSAKRRVAFRYALRVWSLLIWAVKNSSTRFAALGVGAKSGGGKHGGGRGGDDFGAHVWITTSSVAQMRVVAVL